MSQDRHLLTVQNLSVSTANRTLINAISFSMASGERVGLIGESGSGKSVTSTALMGLLPGNLRAAGSIRLAGHEQDLVGAPDQQMRRIRGKDIAMVFQEPLTALNPLMKAGKQVAEIMTQHRTVPGRAAAAAAAVKLLDDVGLPDPAVAAQAYPHELSGGQRQRVMLAMALANNPKLLIADEPTTALDVIIQRQVLDLMRRAVAERGTGLLFITHDLAVVANMCERVLVMNKGILVEEGTAEEIFTRPGHPYTRGLLAASDLEATDARGRLFTVATAAGYSAARNSSGGHTATASTTKTPAAPASVDTAAPGTVTVPAGSNASAAHAAKAEPLITVSNLVRTYGSAGTVLRRSARVVQALKGVSFTARAGDRLGVVGESGSGKSTLLRILAGLDQPTSGSAVVAGNEVNGARNRDLVQLRQNLQIVFQDPMGSLDPRMSVEQIVTEPLRVAVRSESKGERREMAAALLDRVGLGVDALDRYPHQFSGGQRQRISIARALICKPKVLVADEPVSALDVSVRAQVLNLLSDLVDEYALTLVFVSHDLAVVRHLCESVVVMNRGEIVEAGATEDVYLNPQHEYTRRLIAGSLSLRREVDRSLTVPA